MLIFHFLVMFTHVRDQLHKIIVYNNQHMINVHHVQQVQLFINLRVMEHVHYQQISVKMLTLQNYNLMNGVNVQILIKWYKLVHQIFQLEHVQINVYIHINIVQDQVLCQILRVVLMLIYQIHNQIYIHVILSILLLKIVNITNQMEQLQFVANVQKVMYMDLLMIVLFNQNVNQWMLIHINQMIIYYVSVKQVY